jgi:hypothetical protein
MQDDRRHFVTPRSQRGRDIAVRLPSVDDHRLPQLGGQGEVRFESPPLDVRRRVVVMVVQAGLPHRHHLGLA